MNRCTLCLGALLLSAGPAWAQDYDGYAALHRKYADAKVGYMAAMARIPESDAYKKAVEAGDRAAMSALYAELKAPEETMLAAFEAAADANSGTADAVPFLAWIAEKSRDPAARSAAVRTLVDRHAGDPVWERLIPIARYAFDAATRDADLAKIVAATSSDDVKVWARYLGATTRMRDQDASDEVKAAARETIAAITAQHPDSIPAMMEAGAQFIADHLQVGMTAPDIVGEDVDGRPFKLSDYRGKVVVLDFWGDW